MSLAELIKARKYKIVSAILFIISFGLFSISNTYTEKPELVQLDTPINQVSRNFTRLFAQKPAFGIVR